MGGYDGAKKSYSLFVAHLRKDCVVSSRGKKNRLHKVCTNMNAFARRMSSLIEITSLACSIVERRRACIASTRALSP